MPDSYKKLGAIAPADGLEHVLYISPSAKSALVSNITVTNRSSSPQNLSLSVYDTTVSEQTVSSATGRKIFIATADNTTDILTSEDGNSWSKVTLPSSGDGYWRSSVTANGITLILGTAIGYRSTNGTTWTAISLPINSYYDTLVYGNGKFVAVSSGGSQMAVSSVDGITWTQGTLPTVGDWKVTFGNGKFVAVSGSVFTGDVAYSTDGVTWTLGTNIGAANWKSVAYGNGKFIAVKNFSTDIATSTDGINWTVSSPLAEKDWYKIVYGGDRFVIIGGDSNGYAYSLDGTSWVSGNFPENILNLEEYWVNLAYGNGKFISVPQSGGTYPAIISTDGFNWSIGSDTMPTSPNYLRSIEYSELQYLSPIKNQLYSNISIDANSFEILEPGIVLNENNTLVANPGANVTVSAFGVELDVIDKYSILGQAVPVANTMTQLYAPQSGVQSLIRSINITNSSSISSTVSVAIATSTPVSNIDYIVYNQQILPNETITLKAGYTVNSPNVIYVSSASGQVGFSAYGMEL